MLKLIAIALLTLASNTWAGSYYSCTDANGKKSFQAMPCDGMSVDTGAVEIQESNKSGNRTNVLRWAFKQSTDSMTGIESCSASMRFYVGMIRNDFVFARMALIKFEGQIYLAVATEQQHPLVHNNISGLGIKVGENNFQEFNLKIGQNNLGYDPSISNLIISQLSASTEAQVRLRFWPYDQTYDTPVIKYSDLNSALAKLEACEI